MLFRSPGIIFVLGAEQGFPGNDVNVNPFPMVIPVFIMEGRFSALFLSDFILQGCQFFPQGCVVRFSTCLLLCYYCGFCLAPPYLMQKLVAAGGIAIVLVPQGILLIVILMVILSRIELGEWDNLRDDGFAEPPRLV